ncbi:alpha/beta fold hydrolase [Pseudomonas putida]|uniref:Alpha/beta fold hydrolase n=1 Tax=Pseudomonas putida TaxID=303 RepID=A0A1X0ZEB0_PSEPU|nr:alpha/beta hydrolase [Pseudomonas putida]KAF0251430.1 alpha/beta fold hydrolase [Pseudomonas putida]MBH3349605.1 alpha/beta hydrolase [Pseudomonas putida]MCE0958538.1 alpha/beta hydrolase [Pseudomonas putida]MDF3872421.1 alpha/beta hydrolase [Pseudomonas putida]MDF3877138.1 alpha/beta hydrolase [Pseudomonas putida]
MSDLHMREHWVDTPQGKLFAQDWTPLQAQGAPIVLLHDSLGCVALWRDFPAQLAQATGHRVIAYDRLGFGRSDAHPGSLRLGFVEREAQQGFAALRTYFGISDFIVFGHSVGGGMAVACAAAFASQCVGLITESAQAFVEARTLEGIRAADLQFAEPGQLQRLQRYHGNKAEWVLRAWVDNWLSEDFADWNLDAALAQVRCPLLSLHGDDDEFGSPAHPERLVALSGGAAAMQLLQGCGHVPHREQAEAVLKAVARFLR